MTNPNHVFTLMDVFRLKFSDASMLKLIGNTTNLERQITLGNVAKENGIEEVWWCASILKNLDVKNDFLKAAFISLKYAFHVNNIFLKKNDNTTSSLLCIVDILDREINIVSVNKELLEVVSEYFIVNGRDSFGPHIGNAVYHLLLATYDYNYLLNIQAAMSYVRNAIRGVSDKPLIDAICLVFPPIEAEIH